MNELKTVKDLVYRSDKLFGNETFVREYIKKEFRDTSFHDFRNACDSLAAWINKNFTSKAHLAIVGATSFEYLNVFFGIQCSGRTAVPLDIANNPENIADEICRSDCEALFLDDKHVKDIPLFKEKCHNVKYFIHLNKKYDDMLLLSDITNEFAGQSADVEVS